MPEEASAPTDVEPMHSDRAIAHAGEDLLRRKPLATTIAAQLLALPRGESFVFSLEGRWGSGKTSLLNLVETELVDKAIVVRFNPWLFSTADDLLGALLRELGAKLELGEQSGSVTTAVVAMGRYAKILSPLRVVPGLGLPGLVAHVLEQLGDAAGDAAQADGVGSKSVQQQRMIIDDALSRMDRRVVVLIDDLDRLGKREVPEVFRLVRLVADFSNITYVLAFDRSHVLRSAEERFGEDGSWLEKFVQVVHRVPQINRWDLRELLQKRIDAVTHGLDYRVSNEARLHRAFAEVLLPLVETPRDVHRYSNAIFATIQLLGGEVDLADILTLEAFRVHLPDVHERLAHKAAGLYQSRASGLAGIPSSAPSIVEELVKLSGEMGSVVRSALELLFPGAERSLSAREVSNAKRECRVAHRDVFQTYLEGAVPPHVLEAVRVEALVDAIRLPDVFVTQLEDMVATAREERVYERLLPYMGDLDPEHVPGLLTVLVRRYAGLRRERDPGFDMGPEPAWRNLASAALAQAPASDRLGVVVTIVETIGSPNLSGANHLRVSMASPTGAGTSVEDILSVRKRVAARVAGTERSELLKERDLYWLVGEVVNDDPHGDWSAQHLDDDEFLATVVRTSATTTQTLSPTPATSPRLPWRELKSLIGTERLRRLAEATSSPIGEELHAVLLEEFASDDGARTELAARVADPSALKQALKERFADDPRDLLEALSWLVNPSLPEADILSVLSALELLLRETPMSDAQLERLAGAISGFLVSPEEESRLAPIEEGVGDGTLVLVPAIVWAYPDGLSETVREAVGTILAEKLSLERPTLAILRARNMRILWECWTAIASSDAAETMTKLLGDNTNAELLMRVLQGFLVNDESRVWFDSRRAGAVTTEHQIKAALSVVRKSGLVSQAMSLIQAVQDVDTWPGSGPAAPRTGETD